MKNLLIVILVCVVTIWTVQTVHSKEVYSEEECLALNVYHEARGESDAGQYAVADVVLNRVDSKHYPDSICGVVFDSKRWEGYPVRNKCQFSWYCDGKSDAPTDQDAWHKASSVAYEMYNYNRFRGLTEGATHYHTHYVNPRWNRNMKLIGTIGDHIFYLEKR